MKEQTLLTLLGIQPRFLNRPTYNLVQTTLSRLPPCTKIIVNCPPTPGRLQTNNPFLPHTFIITTSQRTFEVHSKNNVNHSTSQEQRQSRCNGSHVILLEIFEQSCTLKRKTCQEDRQVYILEVAQGHPLLHFEDCHLVLFDVRRPVRMRRRSVSTIIHEHTVTNARLKLWK